MIDTDILAAVQITVKGEKTPDGFPCKYSYTLSSNNTTLVSLPGVGDRKIPNKQTRLHLIKEAHEGIASADAGISSIVPKLQQKYQWPYLPKQTKEYMRQCNSPSP